MFKKRVKRTFPKGTFIPTPARVMAILQLCIVFVVICWNGGRPFMDDLYKLKRQTLAYQYVLGGGDLIERMHQNDPEFLKQLERNRERFTQLHTDEQERIKNSYTVLLQKYDRTFLKKMQLSVIALLLDMPPFELLWVFMSLMLSVMVLKKREGAAVAIWLLPAIAFFYSVDNVIYAAPPALTHEQKLFPSDSFLEDHYGEGEAAWRAYLSDRWGNGSYEEGSFSFHLARLSALAKDLQTVPRPVREPWLFLVVYNLWNAAFAFIIWRRCGKAKHVLA
ncbi:MAG: hypothetical protein KDK72_04905 [Chlamydiia bacterium]|nr:hypothetical protein [Chlamydiia bacterium]